MKKRLLFFGLTASMLFSNFVHAQNNSLNFDGVNDYVALNALASQMIGENTYTIEFWINASAMPNNLFGALFAINTTTGNDLNKLVIRMSGPGDGGALNSVALNIPVNSTNNVVCGFINVLDSACHHVAYTYNNGINSLFIDGIFQGSITQTYTLISTDRYSLGQEFDAPFNTLSQLYTGSLDDLRVWSEVRTQLQIQSTMNTQLSGNESNLIALYNCNQGVPSGLNTSITDLVNSTSTPGLNGNLNGFLLNGNTSNFIGNTCSNCSEIDSSYIIQTANIVTNTIWQNKIFIPDNTIITVDNAILDITNVDVVFGQCSGIDFVNGAILRANNSVLRPCNLNDTWRGLRFDGTSNFLHQVNENTFKNAEIALLFGENANAEINSNTFSNCNEGITMNHSLFTESIFGNNFVTNNAFPEFTNCYPTTTPTDVIHIHGIGLSNEVAVSDMSITQNNFTLSNATLNIHATGIDLLNSRATISENTMTNMESSIVINNPKGAILIEGNEIEYNYQFHTLLPSISQISVFNSNGIFVSINNNELRNSKDDVYASSAVYLERSNNIVVRNNQIEGFRFGINTRSASTVNFTENQLSNISNVGIYLDESGVLGTNYITCNDITMIMGQGTSISTDQSSRKTQITSNCIKDGSIGISVVGQNTIPLIRNNFLYNYRTGISNTGHSGNIGTNVDPGMNTLWSNMSSGIDVSSSTPITIANNFGQTNCTWATVSIQGNNAVHSTASCAHQITTANAVSQGNLNTKYNCENMSPFVYPKMKVGNSFVIPSITEASDYLNNCTNKVDAINQMVALEDCNEVYLNQLLENIEIEAEDKNLILYSFYKVNNRLTEANTILLDLNNPKFNDFVSIETLILKKLNGENLTQFDFNELTIITTDPNLDNGLYNLAVGLTKTGQAHGNYRINIPFINENDFDANNSDWIHDKETILDVYPNPSSSELFIQILEGKQVAGQVIKIYDLFGNNVHSQALDFVTGRTKLDISNLAAGSYFIMLESDGIKSERTKFVKM